MITIETLYGYLVDTYSLVCYLIYMRQRERLRNYKELKKMAYSAALQTVYDKGLADERRVINYLKARGATVEESTVHQNKYEDIDCWVNGESVSIKSQEAGVKYQNIGLELCSQLTSYADDELSYVLTRNLDFDKVQRLLATPAWREGWWFTGKADLYLILQGNTLRGFRKSVLANYIKTHGFDRIRSLSPKVKATQGGAYPTCDTISGYIPNDPTKVRQAIWTLPEVVSPFTRPIPRSA